MRFHRRTAERLALFGLLLGFVAAGCADEEGPPPSPAPGDEQLVAMRDGVRLSTSVYRPEGQGPWPVVLRRTPYGKDTSMWIHDGQIERVDLRVEDVARYSDRGYVLVLQDTRGRFKSEGTYRPYEGEIEDGYDTVEWVAAQPFSDGKVGMSGASALGIHTNLAAAAAPPHLVAAFVEVAPRSLFYEGRFIGGAFKWAHGSGWMKRQGLSDEDVRAYAARAVLDERWLASDFVYHRHNVEIPIYNVGGWYDAFSNGTIENFMYLQRYGREGAQGRQKLRMGAFGHGPVLAGDIEYPAEPGLGGTGEEELRWFDHWLKGVDNGITDEPAVSYYAMAAARKGRPSSRNGERTADTWPPPGVHRERYYLGAGGSLRRQRPTARSASQGYRFDPGDPVPTVGGANLVLPIGPDDQRNVGTRNDYLRFQTEPLTAPLTLAGKVELELYVSTDGPDTDFVAKLVDVHPDGYEALVQDTILRARFRNGRRPYDVEPMEPGRVERLELDLWHTALTFESGHQVALHITSSNYPRFDVNPNTGEALGQSTLAPRTAHNTVYFDTAHPSALILPVLPGER